MRLERDSLGDLVLGGMIILKRMLNEEVSILICFIFRSLIRSKNINNQQNSVQHSMMYFIHSTGLFEMIVWVLTTCHTQYT
jgi:hypothetical protein